MILIDLYGGPGAGKTTLSFYLMFRLKMAGIRAELVGEAAREHHIYDSMPGNVAPPLLDNQVLLAGQQFERILRLQRHNFEVAVNDSPLIQGMLYCEGQAYHDHLKKTIRSVEPYFETYKIMIHPRPGSYDPESRVQRTEKEARALDATVVKLAKGKFWQEVGWENWEALGDAVVALALSKRKTKKSAKRTA
jgi:predicted ATPase